jgi:chemotaxis protein MotB
MRSRRGDRSDQHAEGQERWLVSYADFITLLFAFFVILYATAESDRGKLRQFEQSIQKFLMGVGVQKGAAPDTSGDPTSERAKMDSPIDEGLEKYRRGESSELLKEVETYVETNMDAKDIERTVMDIDVSEWGVRVVLSSDNIFAGDSDRFRREALNALDTVLEYVARLGRKTIVESHSDDGQLRSPDYVSGWELTSARATSLTRYLIRRHNMAPDKIVPIGFSDQRPLLPNTSNDNRRKNRRIELLITTAELDL